uniref:ATP-grasp domain-containing protein n=1 Tax=Ditylenchus dipsaci TaxID=166011 RepID=A0A915DA28_9BILA
MGQNCMIALKELGYTNVKCIDAGQDSRKLASELCSMSSDLIVFNAMQGGYSEYGALSGLLDCLRIPYTHSGVMTTALQADKEVSKKVASAAGLKVAESVEFNCLLDDIEQFRHHPIVTEGAYVLKPISNGTSYGVHLFQKGILPPAELFSASNWHYGDRLMLERFIVGREFTCAVLLDKMIGLCEV